MAPLVGSPHKRIANLGQITHVHEKASQQVAAAAGFVIGGGDSAAGPLAQHRASQVSAVSAQLRAISLEYSQAELASATSNWHPSKRLGTGCYGAVYQGELKDGSEVAIKAIDLGAMMGKGESPEDAGFDEEVQMLSRFRHPNLVTLLGWGQQVLKRYLVYEYLAGGDIFQRLWRARQPTGPSFHWYERLSVCQDAATGLSHMHNATPKAFHRDIKSANILLDRHGTAKMADFGLSCTTAQAGHNHVTVKTISGTPGYKCPIYERTGRFTEGSEVYSFGMAMLEVLTGLNPSAADAKAPGGISFPIEEQLAIRQPGAIDRCCRSLDACASWSAELGREFGTLALRGVHATDERNRPVFVEIVRALRNMAARNPSGAAAALQTAQHRPAAQVQVAGPAAPASPKQPLRLVRSPARSPCGAQSPAGAQEATAAAAVASPARSAVAGSLGGAQEPDFFLELVAAHGMDAEAVPPQLRQLPLLAAAGCLPGPDGKVTQQIGRHDQADFFEAWLPDVTSRSCVSRKAIEVAWAPGSQEAWLTACGTNPVSVDGKVIQKGAGTALWPGSEIIFTYELKVLLRLRFVACGPVVTEAPKGPGRHSEAPPPAGPPATTPPRLPAAALAPPVQLAAAPPSPEWSRSPAAAAGAGHPSGVPAGVPVHQAAASRPGCAVSYPASEAASPLVGLAPARAQQGCQGPEAEAEGRWSASRSFELSGEDMQETLSSRMVLLEGSVNDIINRLNTGLVPNPGAFCAVYSAAKSAYYLLYQAGMKETALACLGAAGRRGGWSAEGSPPRRVEASGDATRRAGDRTPQQDRASALEAMAQLEPDAAWAEAGGPRWCLRCVHAEGLSPEQIGQLGPEVRELELSAASLAVGRHHQPLHFEAWLPDPILRFCVSRTHAQLTRGGGGNLVVTNMSSNLLCVDSWTLAKGEARELVCGQVLSFARNEAGSLVHFLKLQAIAGGAPQSRRPPEAASLMQVPGALAAMSPKTTASLATALPATALVITSAAGQKEDPETAAGAAQTPAAKVYRPALAALTGAAPAPARTQEPQREPSPCDSLGEVADERRTVSAGALRAAVSPARAPEGLSQTVTTDGYPYVVLELCGEGVADVPLRQRSVGPTLLGNRPLLVGRRHQPELHEQAVTKECLEFLSRDHFCVAFEGGEFWLLALTSNRMWRDRDGEEPVQLARDDLVTLLPGDRIVLGTGGDVVTAEAARRRLCWHFRCSPRGQVSTGSPWWRSSSTPDPGRP